MPTTADRANLWDAIWFPPQHPFTLVFVRAVVFTTVAVDVWLFRTRFRSVGTRPESLWDPISAIGLVRMPQPSPVVVEALILAVIAGAALTVFRSTSRIGGLVAAGAYAILEMAANSFGKIDHARQILVIMVAVLAVAPLPPSPRRGSDAGAPHWRWAWPVQLCRATFALMLAGAAASKLQRAGLDWVLSENLRNILIAESLVRSVPLEELAQWTASEPWRWKAAAAGALFGEASLMFWFIVPWRRVRTLLIVSGVGTMAGITLLMGLVGFPIVALGAVFISPGALRDDVARSRPAWRAAAGPLTGLAALAAVVVLDKGWVLSGLPLVVGAAVFLWCLAQSRAVGDLATDAAEGLAGTAPRRPVEVGASFTAP